MRMRMLALASTALITTLVLAGCGQNNDPGMSGMDHGSSSSSPSSSEASADFNAADEMFVTMMIPHHAQAVADQPQAVVLHGEAQVGHQQARPAAGHLAAQPAHHDVGVVRLTVLQLLVVAPALHHPARAARLGQSVFLVEDDEAGIAAVAHR